MSSPSKVYLVTGANRGLGLGFVSTIAETRPDSFIYAGVRDPSKVSELDELSRKYPGRIAVVKYVSAHAAVNAALASEIKARHGRVDTVIANVGISNSNESVLSESVFQLEDHFRVNVIGNVVLFQALHDLLKASTCPRFVPISSEAGSIGGFLITMDLGLAAYGASKAALNFVTRKIHFENKWLVRNTPVSRDAQAIFESMARDGFRPLTIYESAVACLGVIENATREKDGGEFLTEKGAKALW